MQGLPKQRSLMQRPSTWLFACVLAAAAATWLALRSGGEDTSSGAAPDGAAPPREGVARIGRFPASQFFIEHDLFLPATDPEAVTAAQASYLRDDDEVFGVVQAGQARAYPIHMIAYHHVVNDVIRGIPVAITY